MKLKERSRRMRPVEFKNRKQTKLSRHLRHGDRLEIAKMVKLKGDLQAVWIVRISDIFQIKKIGFILSDSPNCCFGLQPPSCV